MTAMARTRRYHWHAPEKGTGPAFVISLAAHALLFLAIAFVVRWKTEPAGPVSAELWSGLPPMAEPRPPPPPPPPPVKIERAPEPEPQKAEIVIEQKKPEPKPEPKPEKKVEPPKPDPKVEEKRRAEAEAKAKAEAQAKAEAKAKAESKARAEAQAKAEAKAAALRREKEMMRIAAAAGGTPSTSMAGGTGITDSYRGQVVGCVRPHIVFNVPDNVRPKQYVAEFEVVLLPTGEQAGAPRLVKGSGLAAYDQAVERAIRRCDPFPRPKEGSMPRNLTLTFDPVDTR
jgi:colicin import membrane protein